MLPSARTGFALGAAACIALSAKDAHADFDFQFATNVSGAWVRRSPAYTMEPLSTSAREMSERVLKSRRPLAMLGVGLDLDLTIDDRWRIPLIGGQVWWPVGSYDASVTSIDGSIARLRPWTTFRADALLPGIGRRFKHRRFMWAATIRGGISFAAMDGDVAAAGTTEKLELSAATFLVQAELEGCRRLDPTTRVCLVVTPRLYEYELLNGITFGIRMEWGR